METPAGKRGKPRGWGRPIVITLIAALVITAALYLYQPVWKAKRTEQLLNDRFGYADTYVPAADGSITPDRMEAFLRVRERVYSFCPRVQEHVSTFIQLDSLEHEETLPKATAAREGAGGLKKLFGFGGTFLQFMETRHRALLAEEMGIGEYMYIYVLAYGDSLARVNGTKYAGVEQAYVGPRARAELAQILANQLDSLAASGERTVDPGLADDLRDQIARLEGGGQALPWENGLPPSITTSIRPYADRLSKYYCQGIARIELMQKNRGLNVRN